MLAQPILQIESEFAQALSNPPYLLLLVLFVSGYAFIALSTRHTVFWQKATSNEKVVVGIGIGGGFGAVIFFLTYSTQFSMKFKVDQLTIFYFSMVITSASLILLALHPRTTNTPEETIRRRLAIVAGLIYFFSISAALFSLFLILFVIILYQGNIQFQVLSSLALDLVLWGGSSIFAVIFYLSYTKYVYELMRGRILDDFIPKKSHRISGWLYRRGYGFYRLSDNWKVICVTGIVLLLAGCWVITDNVGVTFTPQITHTDVKPYYLNSTSFRIPSDYYLYTRNKLIDWQSDYSGPCNLTSYQMVSQNFTVKVPRFGYFAFNNPVLQYPNSTDQTPLNFSNILSLSSTTGAIWLNMYVLNQSGAGIEYTGSAIDLDLSKLPHPSQANLNFTFFLKMKPNLDCFETLKFATNSSAGATTYSDIQTLIFKNHENATAITEELDLPYYFSEPYAKYLFNYTETNILNGTSKCGSFILSRSAFYYDSTAYTPSFSYVLPGYELNITITGSCNSGINNKSPGSGACGQ